MSTSTDTINKIKAIVKQVKDLQKELSTLFKADIAAFLKKHEESFDGVRIGVSNHEFSDGDLTSFYLLYEEPEYIHFSKNDESLDDENDETPEIFQPAQKEFSKLLGKYDVEDFFEQEFGNYYESVDITVKDGQLVYS